MSAGLWLIASAAAALLGFAVQRGATCTVAAVGDVVLHGRWDRLVALGEAALWVAAGLLGARALGVSMDLPRAYAPGVASLAGGALIGIGAVVNGACVFGAIARFGSGDWAFAATPLGFFLGCVAFDAAMPAPSRLAETGALVDGPLWLTGVVAALALWRAWRLATRTRAPTALRWHRRVAHHWTPHAATLVIGACFVVMLLSAGTWAYTDALAELARGTTARGGLHLALFTALLGGATLGGWSAGLLGHVRVRARTVLRCLIGGALMAAGSLLVPGSNDGLLLIGLPLLQPYAWLACAAMAGTVAVALRVTRG